VFLQSKIQQFSNDNAGLIPVEACLDVESKWLLDKFLTEKFGMIMPKKIPLGKSLFGCANLVVIWWKRLDMHM